MITLVAVTGLLVVGAVETIQKWGRIGVDECKGDITTFWV